MIVAGLALALAGCASSANQIRAAYVSPVQYQNYTCPQLGEEASRISSRVAVMSGVQDQKATSDAVATGVALVVFWPAAFFIKGDGADAAELGRLKGQFEAVEKIALQKNCGFEFRRQGSA